MGGKSNMADIKGARILKLSSYSAVFDSMFN